MTEKTKEELNQTENQVSNLKAETAHTTSGDESKAATSEGVKATSSEGAKGAANEGAKGTANEGANAGGSEVLTEDQAASNAGETHPNLVAATKTASKEDSTATAEVPTATAEIPSATSEDPIASGEVATERPSQIAAEVLAESLPEGSLLDENISPGRAKLVDNLTSSGTSSATSSAVAVEPASEPATKDSGLGSKSNNSGSKTASHKDRSGHTDHGDDDADHEPMSIEEIKSMASGYTQQIPGDFDWDADDKAFGNYSHTERQKLEEQYEQTLNSITKNEIISGTVVLINNKDVVLNIGFKSDGLVPLSEFRDTPDLKIGDKVDVFVEDQEDKNGQLVLSRKRAKTQKSWDDINKALEMDTIIEGFVKSRTKGGLIVDLAGVEAFLPGSQIDIKPIRDYDIYVGKTMDFKVVKINHEFKNVVVSHKVLIEDDLENQKIDIISKLEKGQVLEGTVKNITAFGVFIDLGGVDGLLHITDISWGRIEHPEEVLKLDQKVNVVVLDFDDDKKRIALGLKQLTPHPWESLDTNLKVGSRLRGKVVTVADYGAFLEIIPGVEGLIHVSEMSWSQHLRSPQEFLKVGDEVDAQILTLDRDERKMSLGIKQLTPDPWVDIVAKYPVGSQHHAIVKNMTNFGVFVEIEEGVDGLIHISDLSWSKKINHPHEFTKVGEKLDVVVLEVDADNRRLSLGHKQLEENPWDTFETIFSADSIHQGTIIKVTDKGAVVALPYGVEGFAPSKHLVRENGTTAGMDETLDFKIIEFNKDQKRIVISHSKIWEEVKAEEKAAETDKRKKDAKATSTAVKKVKESVEKTTLGDLDVLSALKSQLENSEAKASKAKTKEKEKTEEEE